MQQLIPITIIPKYGFSNQVIKNIQPFSSEINFSSQDSIIDLIKTKIKKDAIPKLKKIRNLVDLVVLESLEKTSLSNDFKEINLQNPSIKIYHTGGQIHRGKMSSCAKSQATYHLEINRENPFSKVDPVTLLLQEILPNSKTSFHYHKKTIEYFLPLLGKTILYSEKVSEKIPMIKPLKKLIFTKVLPKTAHQLQTREESAINILCMNPYDPELKDHFYVEN